MPVILLIPPQITDVKRQIEISMQLHKKTQWEEIEPGSGCRRFRLT